MADKVKNLEFNSREPAFIQRLRAQTAGDFNERPAPRPKRLRNAEDDDEDEPVYVDETGNTISTKDFKAMNEDGSDPSAGLSQQNDIGQTVSGMAGDDVVAKDVKPRDAIADVGVKKKRKAVKVVGEKEEEEEEEVTKSLSKKGSDAVEAKAPEAKKVKKSIKGKQKVKLSFGNDEEP